MDRKPDENLVSLLATVQILAETQGADVSSTVWAAMARDAERANEERRELVVSAEEKERRIEELEAERKRFERVASAAVQYRLMQIDLRKAEMEGLVVFDNGRYRHIGRFGAKLLERRQEVMREFRKAVDALDRT